MSTATYVFVKTKEKYEFFSVEKHLPETMPVREHSRPFLRLQIIVLPFYPVLSETIFATLSENWYVRS